MNMMTPLLVTAVCLLPQLLWDQVTASAKRNATNTLEIVVPKGLKMCRFPLDKHDLKSEIKTMQQRRLQAFYPEADSFRKNEGVIDALPRLAEVSKFVANTCATEASCERYFSQQGLAHTAIRALMKDDLVYSEATIRFRADKRRREATVVHVDRPVGDETIAEDATTVADTVPKHDLFLSSEGCVELIDHYDRMIRFESLVSGGTVVIGKGTYTVHEIKKREMSFIAKSSRKTLTLCGYDDSFDWE